MATRQFNTALPFKTNWLFGTYYTTPTYSRAEVRQFNGQLYVVKGGRDTKNRVYCHIGTADDHCVSTGLRTINTCEPQIITMAQLESANF